jgi:uncharacterized glyoxalase superfamily protein PhnB
MTMTDTAPQPASAEPGAMTGVVANLMLSDAKAAAEFYRRAFGAEELRRMTDPNGRIMHCHVRINGGSLIFNDVFPEGQPAAPHQGFNITLPVSDVDSWFHRGVAAGAEQVMAPALMFWGDRYAQLRDPFGVLWALVGPA